VDIRDYGLWRQAFGAASCGNSADLNGDCLVDIRDYGIWRANFGHTAGAAVRTATPSAAPRLRAATPMPLAGGRPASGVGGSAWDVIRKAILALGVTVPNWILLQISEVVP
jgi:hypothetical protein